MAKILAIWRVKQKKIFGKNLCQEEGKGLMSIEFIGVGAHLQKTITKDHLTLHFTFTYKKVLATKNLAFSMHLASCILVHLVRIFKCSNRLISEMILYNWIQYLLIY